MLNLHQLTLFCSVAQRGSLTVAARELYLSQPALSIQLKRLQQSVGLPLFSRTRGGMVLTPAGRELYALASPLLDHVRAVERRTDELRAGTAGTLAVGATPTSAMYYLARALKALAERYPDVEVDVRVELAERLHEHLRQQRLDVALEWGPNVPAGLHAIPLVPVRFLAVAAPTHPLAGQATPTLKHLASVPFIALQHGQDLPSEIEVLLLKEHGLRLNVAMRLPSVDAVKRMVEAGLGVTLLAEATVEREVREGHLQVLPLEGFDLRRSLVALVPTRPSLPMVDRFIALVAETATSPPADTPPAEASTLPAA